MARRILTQEETHERLKTQLEKAREALQILETRLGELDKEREKLTAKIKERRAEVEKYQAILKERQYSVFEETLRLKGLNLDDVTRAIANGDTKYLLELSNLKADKPESETGPGSGTEPEPRSQTEPVSERAEAYTPPQLPRNTETGQELGRVDRPPNTAPLLRPQTVNTQTEQALSRPPEYAPRQANPLRPQNANIESKPEFAGPDNPPKPINQLRPAAVGRPAQPANITQYGQAPAKPVTAGWNAAQP